MCKRGESRGGKGTRTERLLDLLAGCHEAEVNERGDSDAGDGIPVELVDKLEGEGEEVELDSTKRDYELLPLVEISNTYCLIR